MHATIHAKRLTRSPRARLLGAASLVIGVLVAGCGGSPGSPTVANVNSATTSTSTPASTRAATTSTTRTATSSQSSTATRNGAPSSESTALGTFGSGELAFSKCMRANGVPNYPDPNLGGGLSLPNGIDPSSPVFQAAQTKCQKLVPGFGGLPGSGPPPSAQALAHWVKVAQCMRRHGIYQFPDPSTSAPPLSSLHGGGVISDRDGVILVFPATIDMQSRLFARAAAACGFQLTNHNH